MTSNKYIGSVGNMDVVDYETALAILALVNPKYPEYFKKVVDKKSFDEGGHKANRFVDTAIAWATHKHIANFENIHHEVRELFDKAPEQNVPISGETFEERISRRLAYEQSVLNTQRVKEFNKEALRIAEKAKKKIDKRLQEFNEELLDGNVEF